MGARAAHCVAPPPPGKLEAGEKFVQRLDGQERSSEQAAREEDERPQWMSWLGGRRREWQYQRININASRVVLLAGRIRSLEISVAAVGKWLQSARPSLALQGSVPPATTMATPGSNASALASDRLNSPVTIPAVMFIFGVVGNLVAIVVLCKSRKEQKETTFYTLVCGLAVTDLLGTLLVSPVTIATYMKGQWPGGPALCEYSTFILLFFGLSGLSIICAMSIERYLAINHAYFYSHYVDKRLAGLTLFAVYASNVLFCALPNMGLGSSRLQYPDTWCFIDWTTNVTAHAAFSYITVNAKLKVSEL
ncbi:hypothetical protein E2I00_013268 [Balaenoptera physalus]|uniref:G-protein coupled receptors family 1 profile domain-containing protein n=1 Tax=Balaenoptera physalus TaxID=9770 RepID=A0A6A1Q2X0_BALPH|nr:hypothetical protein E2I00_013268 [Balaenoptera physalus]